MNPAFSQVVPSARCEQQGKLRVTCVGRIQFAIADCEDARRGHEECKWPPETGKGKEISIDFPLSQKEPSPAFLDF